MLISALKLSEAESNTGSPSMNPIPLPGMDMELDGMHLADAAHTWEKSVQLLVEVEILPLNHTLQPITLFWLTLRLSRLTDRSIKLNNREKLEWILIVALLFLTIQRIKMTLKQLILLSNSISDGITTLFTLEITLPRWENWLPETDFQLSLMRRKKWSKDPLILLVLTTILQALSNIPA